MPERRRVVSREDRMLLFWSVLLGLALAAAFAAYQAVSASDERVAEFATNLLWPGALIFVGVAAVVWMGWKANLD